MFERQLIVGAAIVLISAASYAQELTRETVQAELARAQAAGEIGMVGEAWDGSFGADIKPGAFGRPFAEPALSREVVMAELDHARASGQLASQQTTTSAGTE